MPAAQLLRRRPACGGTLQRAISLRKASACAPVVSQCSTSSCLSGSWSRAPTAHDLMFPSWFSLRRGSSMHDGPEHRLSPTSLLVLHSTYSAWLHGQHAAVAVPTTNACGSASAAASPEPEPCAPAELAADALLTQGLLVGGDLASEPPRHRWRGNSAATPGWDAPPARLNIQPIDALRCTEVAPYPLLGAKALKPRPLARGGGGGGGASSASPRPRGATEAGLAQAAG